MNFVIPMAGRGQRFVDAGYALPKMLIEAKGKTLLQWSVDSLPLALSKKLVFIGLEEHKVDWDLESKIYDLYGKTYHIEFVWLKEVTRGQSETVLRAQECINFNEPLVIYNIDTAFKSRTLAQKLKKNDANILGSFFSDKTNYSYARLNTNGIVVEVREKEVISEHALTGLYHFRKSADFFTLAEEAIQHNETIKNEFYIAPLYNKLIAQNQQVMVDQVSKFTVLGTPEELKDFMHG